MSFAPASFRIVSNLSNNFSLSHVNRFLARHLKRPIVSYLHFSQHINFSSLMYSKRSFKTLALLWSSWSSISLKSPGIFLSQRSNTYVVIISTYSYSFRKSLRNLLAKSCNKWMVLLQSDSYQIPVNFFSISLLSFQCQGDSVNYWNCKYLLYCVKSVRIRRDTECLPIFSPNPGKFGPE